MTAPCQYATFRPHRLPSADIPIGARSVGRHTVPKNWEDNSFTINYVSLLWTISGCGQVVINGKKNRCPENHLAVYLPGMLQSFHTTASTWEYCWWTIDGPQAAAIAAGFGLTAGVHKAGPAPVDLIDRLQSQIVLADRASEIDAGTTALALTAEVAKALQFGKAQIEEDTLVKEARILIKDNWQHVGFGVDSLAANLGINRSTLSRRFHEATGNTVIHYLISMRIQNAITLLRQSDLSPNEIADRCGYGDPDYFRRVFRKRMGLTPNQFRESESE